MDQNETMSAMEYGTDNSVEEDVKRYRDPVTPIEGRSAFIVGIHDGADWRDMAVLATIPAASMIQPYLIPDQDTSDTSVTGELVH